MTTKPMWHSTAWQPQVLHLQLPESPKLRLYLLNNWTTLLLFGTQTATTLLCLLWSGCLQFIMLQQQSTEETAYNSTAHYCVMRLLHLQAKSTAVCTFSVYNAAANTKKLLTIQQTQYQKGSCSAFLQCCSLKRCRAYCMSFVICYPM